MLILLSPAKNLDLESGYPDYPSVTEPRLLEDSCCLVDQLKSKSPEELAELMKLSHKLAVLNVERYQQWSLPLVQPVARPALYTFNGDVYAGLNASELSPHQVNQAQSSIRILSGLYGLLRPMDLILPYRLEMGTKLENNRGKDLYRFWGDTITEMVQEDLKLTGSQLVVNLASNEYSKAVNFKQLSQPTITPVFKDQKGGQYKVISFYAKKARGRMANYLLSLDQPSLKDLQAFNWDGYQFDASASSEQQMVFLRDEDKSALR